MTFDGLLNLTATILRLDNTVDRYGNIDKFSYDTHASNIKVRIDNNTTIEEEIDSNSTNINGKIFTKYSELKNTDIIQIDNINWQVIGEPLPKYGNKNIHHYEVQVKKVII